MYKKMGKEGWQSLIPFYNAYVLFDVLYERGWRFLTLLIPFYNIYVIIRLMLDLADAFGQSNGFAAGLLLINPVFEAILGLDSNISFRGAEQYENDFVDNIISNVSRSINDAVNSRESDEVTELKKLKVMRDEELISEEEYAEKRKEVVSKI
ncbi:MAG: SHOCT domain-containing protein [Erysipelotrichaceae bacterium]|nr:SHOCT domain-containing protein [Erysipelotrichaceae bacterium]